MSYITKGPKANYVDKGPSSYGKVDGDHAEVAKNNPGIVVYQEKGTAMFKGMPISYGVFSIHDGKRRHDSPEMLAGGSRASDSPIGGAPAGVKNGTGEYDKRHHCVVKEYTITHKKRGGIYGEIEVFSDQAGRWDIYSHRFMGLKVDNKFVFGISEGCFSSRDPAHDKAVDKFWKKAHEIGGEELKCKMMPSIDQPHHERLIAAWRDKHDPVYIARNEHKHEHEDPKAKVKELAENFRKKEEVMKPPLKPFFSPDEQIKAINARAEELSQKMKPHSKAAHVEHHEEDKSLKPTEVTTRQVRIGKDHTITVKG